MKIAVVGTGYVGLVVGACFAETGNDVVCIDKMRAKVNGLKRGKMPIFEPGLEELVVKNAAEGRLTFTTNLAEAVHKAEVVFIAVGTPPGPGGNPDLTYLKAAAEGIGQHILEDDFTGTPRAHYGDFCAWPGEVEICSDVF